MADLTELGPSKPVLAMIIPSASWAGSSPRPRGDLDSNSEAEDGPVTVGKGLALLDFGAMSEFPARGKVVLVGGADLSSSDLRCIQRDDSGVFFDIRTSNRGGTWTGASLKGKLGSKYFHLPELGNLKASCLARLASGYLERAVDFCLLYLHCGRTVYLFCQERSYADCHRLLVAGALVGAGGVTVHEFVVQKALITRRRLRIDCLF
ncbi:hypothetical protein AK812_SmicGene24830 [Symbiodinium microadriaticum]|uniref:Uncharacterized protein n=1 Tax=Symbiodinium microadriaticum TaxID=2951 RepID=A0A1Q9DDN5_SYMMI|nr:hypothetical protein AK812_SmicGene24830 [Symbiodinium microadriaticum]